MRCLLIDANNMLRRNIMATALDDLKAGGVYTGGLYVSIRQLSNAVKQLSPSLIVAFYDGGIPKARMKAIPEYKRERKERKELMTDEEKKRAYGQITLSRDIFKFMGVLCLKYNEREADDCLAAAAQLMVADGHEVIVMSGDRDLLQVVDYGASWYSPAQETTVEDAEDFEGMTGVIPGLYVLYRALVGDPSDGIAGVHGIGEKKAAAMLMEYAGVLPKEPHDALDALSKIVKRKEKKHKHEEAFLAEVDRLHNIIDGIDLRASFGKTGKFHERIYTDVVPDKIKALKFFRRYKMKTMFSYADDIMRPMLLAYRLRKKYLADAETA